MNKNRNMVESLEGRQLLALECDVMYEECMASATVCIPESSDCHPMVNCDAHTRISWDAEKACSDAKQVCEKLNADYFNKE